MEQTTTASAIQSDFWAVIAFLVYLAVIVGVGIWSSRFSSKGISEYFIAGRKMNRFVMALSAVVSGRSAWLLIGMTGMAYSVGAQAVWAVAGYIIVEFFLFLYYARRIRRFAEAHDTITIPDFFASRFGDKNGLLRIVLVAIILIFMVGYVSAQFVAGGKAFASGFNLSPISGIVITAIIVLVYTIIGGFLAVSLTDMIQAILMLLSLVILPVIVLVSLGGWQPAMAELSTIDSLLIDPFALSAGVAIGLLGIGLGSPGNPHIVARYLSIEHPSQLKTACYVGTFWNILMAAGALITGLAGRAVFPEVSMLPAADTENLFPLLANAYLHPVLFGVVIASVFAAIMSTADSQLLVAASCVVRDVYEKILKKGQKVSQKTLVFLSRLVVAILVILSLLFGLIAEDLVFWLVLFAWAGLGAALGPTTILALYWDRTTRAGVLAGMITGTMVTIIWYFTPVLKDAMYELIPGFIAGLIATIVVSLFTKPPEDGERQIEIMKKDY